MTIRSFAVKPKPRELEADIMAEVRQALAALPDVTIARNNVGVATMGRAKVRYGLGIGSADLIGSLTIEMYVPQGNTNAWMPIKIARALGVEVKRPGQKPDDDQKLWAEDRRRRGWIVGVVHNAAEAIELIERARRWEI